MKNFSEWVETVFVKHRNALFLGPSKWNQSRLLCYLLCASELVRLKASKTWFARSIDEIASDLKITNRTASRYMKELRQQNLVVSKKQFLGCNLRLMLHANSHALENSEFIAKEVNRLPSSQVKVFIEELIPVKKIMQDIESAFCEPAL